MPFTSADLPTLLRQSPPTPRATRGTGRTSRRKAISCLEHRFDLLWAALDGPELEKEVMFHPTRKWRLDRAHRASKTAIEIEGGIWTNGAHTRGEHFQSDAVKYNAAAALGWTVFRLTGGMISEPHLRPILERIRKDGEK